MERHRQTSFEGNSAARGNGRGGDNPDAIQEDIHRTRERIDETLDAIKHQLSAGDLINQALHMFRGEGGSGMSAKAGDLLSSLARTVKENPVPVALIGIGLLGLTRDGGGHSRGFGSHPQGGERDMGEAAGKAGEQLHETAEHAREKLHETAEHAREKLHEARESMERGYERVRQRIEDDPIVLGALGIALGAALGAGLPHTRLEDEKLGEKRDELAAKAKQVGKRVSEQIREGVRQASEQGQDESMQALES